MRKLQASIIPRTFLNILTVQHRSKRAFFQKQPSSALQLLIDPVCFNWVSPCGAHHKFVIATTTKIGGSSVKIQNILLMPVSGGRNCGSPDTRKISCLTWRKRITRLQSNPKLIRKTGTHISFFQKFKAIPQFQCYQRSGLAPTKGIYYHKLLLFIDYPEARKITA